MGSFARKLAALLFLMAVAGCAAWCRSSGTARGIYYTRHPADHVQVIYVPVYADEAFDDRVRDNIRIALWHWNRTLNGHMQFVVADLAVKDLEDNIEVRHRIDLLDMGLEFVPSGFDEDTPGLLGLVRGADLHVIHLNAEAEYAVDLSVVAMHEMGHTFGLGHTQVQGSLLFPIYSDQAPCVDEITVQTLAAVQGWNYQHLNWCEHL